MKLTRVNEFLKKNEICVQQDNPVLNAPDTIKNIVVSEIVDIARLEKISDELITYLSKDTSVSIGTYGNFKEFRQSDTIDIASNYTVVFKAPNQVLELLDLNTNLESYLY